MNKPVPNPLESDLDAILQRELPKLPDQKAPATLAPRVLAALRAREQPAWWRQPFWAWTPLAKAAGFGLLLAGTGFMVGLSFILIGAGSKGGILTSPMAELLAAGAGFADTLAALAHALLLVLRVGLQPWILGALAVSGLMYLVCLGLGTAFFHWIYKHI